MIVLDILASSWKRMLWNFEFWESSSISSTSISASASCFHCKHAIPANRSTTGFGWSRNGERRGDQEGAGVRGGGAGRTVHIRKGDRSCRWDVVDTAAGGDRAPQRPQPGGQGAPTPQKVRVVVVFGLLSTAAILFVYMLSSCCCCYVIYSICLCTVYDNRALPLCPLDTFSFPFFLS
jgi:hypothetical protein